jgi:sterol desaturase/sphingolipid hydroxylase (fatty acid hydroxylase superfamily)
MNTLIVSSALLFALLERFPQLRFRPVKLMRSYFLSDLFYLLTGYIAGGTLAISYIMKGSNWIETTLALPRLTAISLPLPITVLLALIILDFGNYLSHYLLHRSNILWQFHKVHHSITQLDWLATFRSHLVEQTLRRLIAPLLLIIIGFPLNSVLIAAGIVTFWGIFNHSNLRLNLALLEPIFITPRLHRLHHAGSTSQRNLGTVFTIWDRLRGSLLIKELPADCKFGNGETSYPQTWLYQFFKPVSDLRNLARNLK